MTILDIGIFTGFIPDEKSLEEVRSRVEAAEKSSKILVSQIVSPEKIAVEYSVHIRPLVLFTKKDNTQTASSFLVFFTFQLKKNVRPTVDRFEFSDRSVVLYVSEVNKTKN